MDKRALIPINDKKYSFNDAMNIIKDYDNNNNIGMRLDYVIIEQSQLKNLDDIKLTPNQFMSNEWEIVSTDYVELEKINEVRDFMMEDVPGFELDTRFYNESEMDIRDWFNKLHDWLNDKEVMYKIFIFLRDSKLLTQKNN